MNVIPKETAAINACARGVANHAEGKKILEAIKTSFAQFKAECSPRSAIELAAMEYVFEAFAYGFCCGGNHERNESENEAS